MRHCSSWHSLLNEESSLDELSKSISIKVTIRIPGRPMRTTAQMTSGRDYWVFFKDAMTSVHRVWLLIFSAIACNLVVIVLEGAGVLMFLPLLELLTESGFNSDNALLAEISEQFRDKDIQTRIFMIAVFIFTISVLKAVFEFSSNYLIHAVNVAVARALSVRAFRYFFQSSVLFAESASPGQTVSMIAGLPQRISGIINQAVAILVNLLLAIVYVGLMLLISVELTGLALVFIGLSFLTSVFLSRKQREQGRRVTEESLDVAGKTTHLVQNFRTVKLFNKTREVTDAAAAGFLRLSIFQRKVHAVNAMGQPILTALGGVFIATTLIVGIVIYDENASAWVAQIILFLLILYRLMGPAAQINNARLSILSNISAVDTFAEFEGSAKKYILKDGAHDVAGLRDDIVFDNVTFRYDEEGPKRPSLNCINLKIEKSQMVGIVGKSGSGKSTLAFLLARMMDPISGCILVDGVDLRNFRQERWLKNISYVSQSVKLMPGTISGNLRLAAPNCSDDEMRAALRAAELEAFVDGLPNGVNTDLGELSSKLSSGQAQRLMIARTLINKPDIIVLDEPTSHLDNVTTETIRRVINELKGTTTLVLISHNIKNLQKADTIFLLSDGELVDTGTHHDLLKSSAIYNDFVRGEAVIGEEASDESQSDSAQW